MVAILRKGGELSDQEWGGDPPSPLPYAVKDDPVSLGSLVASSEGHPLKNLSGTEEELRRGG